MLGLTDSETPSRGRFRAAARMLVFYMPGDTGGLGFGSTVIDSEGISYQSGTWSGNWRMESSNFREADNLVLRLEVMVKADKVAGHKIFMFTDNMVFEACYYKGHLESEKLSDIIFRLNHQKGRDGLSSTLSKGQAPARRAEESMASPGMTSRKE